MKKLTLFILIGVFPFASSTFGQQVNFMYGSAFDGGSNTASIFTNELKVGYETANPAVLTVGYFNNGFDVPTQAATIADSATLSTFLSDFNLIGETSFASATAAGFLASANTVNEVGVGSTPYILVLGGIDSFANGSNADEIGLFTNAAFGTIPSGAEPLPADYNLQSVTLDSVVLGKEYLGESLTGAFAGVNGNIYATQAIGQVIPEPSTYALFLGACSLGFVYWRKRKVKSVAQD